jgi:outer membrane protein assembly factor BamB
MLMAVPAGAATSADWPQDGAGPGLRWWNRNETTIGKANVTSLKLTAQTSSASMPIVAGGRVFTTWQQYTPDLCPTTEPLTQSAIDATVEKTSTPVWRRQFDGVIVDLAAVGGRLFVYQIVDAGCGDTSLWTTHVLALNPATGATLWQRSWPYSDSTAPRGFAVDETTLAVSTGAATGYLDPATGTLRGTAPAASSAVVLKNGTSYLTTGGKVRAYTKNGSPLGTWTPLDAGTNPALMSTSELVYLRTDTAVRALDPSTGKQRFKIAAPSGQQFAAIAADSSRLYAETRTTLLAYDRYTGVRRWAQGAETAEQLVVANGVIYVVHQDDVVASDAATGKTLWSTSEPYQGTLGYNLLPPVIANGRLYVGSDWIGNDLFYLYTFSLA